MNNQFATQFLLQETEDEYSSLESALRELGTSEDAIKVLMSGVRTKNITPEGALEIAKLTVRGVHETSAVGGGVTGGPTAATFTAGTGEQVATTKAFGKKKKYQEDAPRLAGDPSKTNKQGTKNLTTYKNFGFTKAPSAKEAAKHIKGVEVKDLWAETLEESRAYSKFKKEAATRSRDQQMHEAVKMIHKRLEEVSKLLEYAQQMRAELSEGEQTLEYNHNTKKVFERINSKVVEIYSKTRQLK